MNNLLIEKSTFPSSKKNKLFYETLFHVANGYMGVRGSIEELPIHPGTYINGVYESVDVEHAEPLYGLTYKKDTIVNIANIQGLEIFIDNEKIDFEKCKVLNFKQTLDMKNGLVYRETSYLSPNNIEINIKTERMASYKRANIFLFSYSISTNSTKKIKVKSYVDNKVSNYVKKNDPRANHKQLAPIEAQFSDETTLHSKIKNSNIKIKIEANFFSKLEKKISYNLNSICCTYENNERIDFHKIVEISDSLRKIKKTENLDINENTLKKEQTEYLNNFWKLSRIEIGGDEKLEKALNYNLYQLQQSKSQDSFAHLGAKGLSGEGYEGHYFWDTEMYCQPFFTLTNPKESKQLLMYRYKTMKQAKDNAIRLGHKMGILFPWRTISGNECSAYFPAGTAQYHINSAIAYAIIFYYHCTNDKEFMINYGLELLLEICRLFFDLGNFNNGKFEIHEVTGPDEYTCLVSNNYYTNVSVKYDFENLISISKELNYYIDENEINNFKQAYKKIYLPKSEKLKICLQDDSFINKPIWDLEKTSDNDFPLLLNHHPLELYRYQVCKQPDVVLANYLYPQYQNNDYIENSYLYYKKITTHDSSLSSTIFSIAATRLKLGEEALSFFGNSAYLDLDNLKKNTEEGIHTANMGGCYLAIVFGFAGLEMKNDLLSLNPTIPNKWEYFSFSIIYRKTKIKFKIFKNKIEIHSENEITILLNSKKYTILGDFNETI